MSKYRIEIDTHQSVKPFVTLHTDSIDIAEQAFVALLPYHEGARLLRDGSWEGHGDRILAQYDAPPLPSDSLSYDPVPAINPRDLLGNIPDTNARIKEIMYVPPEYLSLNETDPLDDVAMTDGSSDDR